MASKLSEDLRDQVTIMLDFLNELTKLGALQWQKKPTSDSKNVLVSSCVSESEFEASEDFEASEGSTIYSLAVRKSKLNEWHATSQKNKSSLKVTGQNAEYDFCYRFSDLDWGNREYPSPGIEAELNTLWLTIRKQQEGGCADLVATKRLNRHLADKLSAFNSKKEDPNDVA